MVSCVDEFFYILAFFLFSCSVAKKGVLKFPTAPAVTVDLSISLFSFCFTYLQLSCLVAYTFRIALSLLYNFVIVNYPPVSLIIFFLMSIISDINIGISAFF